MELTDTLTTPGGGTGERENKLGVNEALKCKTLGGIHMQALHHALNSKCQGPSIHQQAVYCIAYARRVPRCPV